jgi:hypothetical protein
MVRQAQARTRYKGTMLLSAGQGGARTLPRCTTLLGVPAGCRHAANNWCKTRRTAGVREEAKRPAPLRASPPVPYDRVVFQAQLRTRNSGNKFMICCCSAGYCKSQCSQIRPQMAPSDLRYTTKSASRGQSSPSGDKMSHLCGGGESSPISRFFFRGVQGGVAMIVLAENG